QIRDEQLSELQGQLAQDEPSAEPAPAESPAALPVAGADLESDVSGGDERLAAADPALAPEADEALMSERLFADEEPGQTAVTPVAETAEPAPAASTRSPVTSVTTPEPSLLASLLSWLAAPM